MRRITSGASHKVYKHALKPLLFRMSADSVHENMIRGAGAVQKLPLVRLAPQIWAYKNEQYLRQELMGIEFLNPVGLSAGLDKNFKLIRLMRAIGCGFMTGGSITYRKNEGNPRPWFTRLLENDSIAVHAGLPSEGARRVARRLKKISHNEYKNMPLIASIAKTNSEITDDTEAGIEDYLGSFKVLELVDNLQIYELNISCPNTSGGEPFTVPKNLDLLLSRIDKLNLERPLTVKMPTFANWTHFHLLLKVILRHNVQAVTIGNLQKDRKFLEHPIDESIEGGLSGRPAQKISTALIRRTYELYGDKLIIIGVGGVFSAEDAYEKIKAGASLVGLVTGLIFEGPQTVGQINRGLVKLLKADGYDNISQAVGEDLE